MPVEISGTGCFICKHHEICWRNFCACANLSL